MTRSSLRKWSIWILKANAIVWAVNGLLLAILVLLGFSWGALFFSQFFSKITLLETGVVFLVGGALAFSGSISLSKTKEYFLKSEEKWSTDKLRESEKRANKYLAFAVILFAESILISFLGV